MALRLEGGPITSLFQRAKVRDGVESGASLASVLTFWCAGGVVWRL
jgi:hypothetical protein